MGSFHTSEERMLPCPVCGSDFVHMEDPEILRGQDDYKGHANVRGDVIVLRGWCEEGLHQFKFFFGFHKGQTRVWYERLEDKTPEPEEDWEQLKKLMEDDEHDGIDREQ